MLPFYLYVDYLILTEKSSMIEEFKKMTTQKFEMIDSILMYDDLENSRRHIYF